MGRRHGMSNSITYRSWRHMVSRCNNPSDVGYASYGGAGVTVYPSWTGVGGFQRFAEHAGERPTRAHTIDRIDNSKGYWPGNVRWATKAEQSRNRRSTIMITINGVTKCASEWAIEHGIQPDTAHMRIKNGWPASEAVTSAVMPYGQVRKPGARNGLVGLTEDQARAMLRAWEASHKGYGERSRIARDFGVTRRVAEGLLNRKTWRHVG